MKKISKKLVVLMLACIFTVAGALNAFAGTQYLYFNVGDINVSHRVQIAKTGFQLHTMARDSKSYYNCDLIEQDLTIMANVNSRGNQVSQMQEVSFHFSAEDAWQLYTTHSASSASSLNPGSNITINYFAGDYTATCGVTADGEYNEVSLVDKFE